jgi:hypothetical protein
MHSSSSSSSRLPGRMTSNAQPMSRCHEAVRLSYTKQLAQVWACAAAGCQAG